MVDSRARDVLSWPPPFSPVLRSAQRGASFSASSQIEIGDSDAGSLEPPPTDQSMEVAATPRRTYLEALLSTPSRISPPTPRWLVFSPVKGCALCFRCLSPEHGVGGYRDPLLCKSCGRFSHRAKGCELSPLTYSRSTPSLAALFDPPRSPRLRRPSSTSPSTPQPAGAAPLLPGAHWDSAVAS
jgi:hypothetical protein